MAKKGTVLVEKLSNSSQYDSEKILKDVHSLPGHFLRFRDALTLVKTHFDSFTVSYNADDKPENIEYYVGIEPHLTTIGITQDVNYSLAGLGFILTSARKEKRYALYYTVSGVGNAPNISNVENIEIPIEANDSSYIVALATKTVLDTIEDFKVNQFNSVLEIKTAGLGETNNTISFGSLPFLIQNTKGENELIRSVEINYSESGDPIWDGQELKGYIYNIYYARFEPDSMANSSFTQVEEKSALNVLNADTVVWDEINTTFPDTVTELYTYSYKGDAVQTVTVTYGNTAKTQIISVVKARI